MIERRPGPCQPHAGTLPRRSDILPYAVRPSRPPKVLRRSDHRHSKSLLVRARRHQDWRRRRCRFLAETRHALLSSLLILPAAALFSRGE